MSEWGSASEWVQGEQAEKLKSGTKLKPRSSKGRKKNTLSSP